MKTKEVIRELDDYLLKSGYYSEGFDSKDNSELNTAINSNWKDKIEKALNVDFKKLLNNPNLEVLQRVSRFDINDNDEQGATIWKSFIRLTDNKEQLDVVISLIVNHNNSFIYLGKSDTDLDSYTGLSDTLKKIFEFLKSNENQEILFIRSSMI